MPPFIVGSMGQKAGRRMPRILPILSVAAATRAPVAPVETRPATDSSVLSIEMAFIMELSFLSLIASVGLSSPVIASGAWTISTLEVSVKPSLFSSERRSFSPPVSIRLRSGYFCIARTAASTFARGLLSPPRQSIISFMLSPPAS